jgi:hypothetical protein
MGKKFFYGVWGKVLLIGSIVASEPVLRDLAGNEVTIQREGKGLGKRWATVKDLSSSTLEVTSTSSSPLARSQWVVLFSRCFCIPLRRNDEETRSRDSIAVAGTVKRSCTPASDVLE